MRLDDASGGVDRWPPQAAPSPAPAALRRDRAICRWVTFDTPQSRSLLEGEQVDFVPFVGGRDPINLAAQPADRAPDPPRPRNRQGREHGLLGGPPYFAPRAGPRLGVSLHRERRARHGAVHDGSHHEPLAGRAAVRAAPALGRRRVALPGIGVRFLRADGRSPRAHRIRRVVVTLGTYRGYGFPRLVRRLLEVIPSEAEVLWQTGDTDTRGFGVEAHEAIRTGAETGDPRGGCGGGPRRRWRRPGPALETGKCPVLVPRRHARGEHIDDHQIQIASELRRRGLSVSVRHGRPHAGRARGGRRCEREDASGRAPFVTVQ